MAIWVFSLLAAGAAAMFCYWIVMPPPLWFISIGYTVSLKPPLSTVFPIPSAKPRGYEAA